MSKKLPRLRMSDAGFELVAARFRVLSETSRLKLVAALEEGEKNVTELVEATGLTQANVSRHLQTLTMEGILSRRKEGLSVFYAIADPAVFDLCDHVCGGVQKRLAQHTRAVGNPTGTAPIRRG